jgi:hypothetical protein
VLDCLVKTPPSQSKNNIWGLAQEQEDQMRNFIMWSAITSTLFAFGLSGYAGVISAIG